MQRRFVALIAVVAVLAMPALASAAVTVTVGNNVLAANTPGQVINIQISATAGEGLNSMDLNAIVNNNLGSSPIISGFNISTAPTLWAANATTVINGVDPPGTEIFESVVNNSAVDSPIGANSILATLTIDTTGFFAGSWPLSVGPNGSSTTAPTTLFSVSGEVVPQYLDGNISIAVVPEPSSIILGLFAAAGMAAVVIRRRRSA